METLYALAIIQGRDLVIRQFDTPERRHRAEVLATRDPWRQRYTRHLRRLRLLASQSSKTVAASGSY